PKTRRRPLKNSGTAAAIAPRKPHPAAKFAQGKTCTTNESCPPARAIRSAIPTRGSSRPIRSSTRRNRHPFGRGGANGLRWRQLSRRRSRAAVWTVLAFTPPIRSWSNSRPEPRRPRTPATTRKARPSSRSRRSRRRTRRRSCACHCSRAPTRSWRRRRRRSVQGWDFVDNDPDPSPAATGAERWHGSHVSGTIGATGDNRVGVTGVNWKVSLMALRAIGPQGGRSDDLARAIDFAADHGARIINASWGGGGASQVLSKAIERAGKKGVLFVAAAGNDAAAKPDYPASLKLDNVLSVGATTPDEVLAPFSD